MAQRRGNVRRLNRAPARRRMRAMRRIRSVPRLLGGGQMVHSFKRSSYNAAYQTVTTADIGGSFAFNLNLVPSAAEFTALFDQYRIDKIVWTLMPRGNSGEQGTNNLNTKVFSVLDYDDDTAPTSLNTLLQYPGVKCTKLAYDHKRTIRPKFATTQYRSLTTSAYGARSGWLDCDYSDVPHYGIKFWIQGPGSGTQIIDLKTDFYLSFKGVR